MHISEGILSGPVLAGGWAIALAGVGVGVRRLKDSEVPKAAVISAAFFVASLIHLPIGPSSTHMLLIGLNGLLLGWVCFPVMFVALLLQAILFQFGGIVVLGVNTIIMALPAVIVYLLFARAISQCGKKLAKVLSFLSGVTGVFLSAILCSLALLFTEKNFLKTAQLIVVAHIPVMILEGILTVFVISFLTKVKPDFLNGGGA